MFTSAVSLILSKGFIHSSKTTHETLLKNVLRWPMDLFDTTPLGRILNRFSKEVDAVDNVLPEVIKSWMMTAFAVKISSNIFSCVLELDYKSNAPVEQSNKTRQTELFHHLKFCGISQICFVLYHE